MVTRKNLLLASILAGATALAASSSFASGPIVLGSVTAPITPKVSAVASTNTAQAKALSTYRQIRSFWLSRAIVR